MIRTSMTIVTLALVGCAGTEPTFEDTPEDIPIDERARIEGRVQNDSQSAEKVESYRVNGDGTLVLQFESTVDSDGSYAVEIEAMGNGGTQSDTDDFAIVKAIDGEGRVVGWVLVEETGSAEGSVLATPMDAESTVEAMAWLNIVQRGDVHTANHADIRARVDADLAAELSADTETLLWGSEALDDLSAGLEAAMATEIAALAELGHDMDVESIYALEKSGSLELSARLHAAADESEVDDAQFLFTSTTVTTLESELELTAEESSTVSSVGWLSFVSSLEALGSADAVIDSSLLLYGEVQAWVSARATEAVVTSEGWNQSLVADVEAALEGFVDSCDDAEDSDDLDAMGEAWADFEAEVVGTAETSDGMLAETLLDLDAVGLLAYSTASQGAVDAAATLFAEVEGHAATYTAGRDVDAMAEGTVDAWVDFEGSVRDISTGLMADLEGQADLEDGVHFFTTVFTEGTATFPTL